MVYPGGLRMHAAASCAGVMCQDGEVCVQGRCQCDESKRDCSNIEDIPVCGNNNDSSCDVIRSRGKSSYNVQQLKQFWDEHNVAVLCSSEHCSSYYAATDSP